MINLHLTVSVVGFKFRWCDVTAFCVLSNHHNVRMVREVGVGYIYTVFTRFLLYHSLYGCRKHKNGKCSCELHHICISKTY